MDILNTWVPYASIGVIIGLVGIAAAYMWKGKERTRFFAGITSFFLLVLSLAAILYVPAGPPTEGKDVGAGAPWTVVVPTTAQGGGRDAAAEIFNDGTGSEFTLDCTADTPDGTLTVSDTNMFDENDKNLITVDVDLDRDASPLGATFSAPDCFSIDFFVKPEYTVDENQDGNPDTQYLYAKVRSISRFTVADNATSQIPVQVFFYTMSEGYYIAWMTEDADQTGAGVWVSAAENAIGKQTLSNSDFQWEYLADWTSGAGVYVAFALLLDSNTPWWGYEVGDKGDTETVILDFGHPTKTGYTVDESWTIRFQVDDITDT